MKKTIKVLSLVALLFTAGFAFMSMADAGDGEGGPRIKVYIVNECSSDVDYKVASPGSSTHYTAPDGSKTAKTFQEGTKIYNSDGKMVMEVTSESEGDEVVVCE
jgi:hypothetical protein